MRDSKLNICQRIAGVMGKVDYLKKEKTVDTYKVVTHDQVTAEVRPHFIEFGIVIVPSLVSDNVALTGTLTGKGRRFCDTKQSMTFASSTSTTPQTL